MFHLEDFRHIVSDQIIADIYAKARKFYGRHVVHLNATYQGGGVAEILYSLVMLMNDVGIDTGWRILHGSQEFFEITKSFHNALQGGRLNLSERKKRVYTQTNEVFAHFTHLDHDCVIVHDPQPLALIQSYRKRQPWIWRCHIDLTNRNETLWNYLHPTIEKYDAVILSLKEYAQNLKTPQAFFMPAIDPFKIKNRPMEEEAIQERLDHYKIPTDLPLVVQISRFDRWKDPGGVIEAFKLARKEVDCTLVLLGNVATDDPEGAEVYGSLLDQREERIILLSHQDTALVNALQRRAAVVLQKSIREGFGLTVAEAMWKGTPVIGGNVGGIRHQIEDGVNGFLVSSPEQAARRIVQLLKDEKLRRQMGAAARESVKKNFLLTRYVEQYLDLFSSFETIYRLKHIPEESS
jgi:trehalose synthase